MGTNGGGGEVDNERDDFKRLIMIPGWTPTPVSFIFFYNNWVIRIRIIRQIFFSGHLCFSVTVCSLSHVTVCHSVYLFQLPLLEAEDSCNMLPVRNWCHVDSDSVLIIFQSSSNSPQTAWWCIIHSDYLN